MQETLAKLSDNPFCYEPSADDIAGGERVGRYQEAHQCEGAAEAEETAGPAKVLAFVNIVMRITAGVRGVKCATDRIPIAARERERAGLYPEAHQCGHASDGEKEVDPAKPLAFVNTIRGITAGWRAAKYAANRILVATRVFRRTVHRLTVRSQPRNRHRSRRSRRSSARSSSTADGDPPGDVARYGRVGGAALAAVDQRNSVELDRIYTAPVADLRSRRPEAGSPMNFGPPTEPIRDLRGPRGGR